MIGVQIKESRSRKKLKHSEIKETEQFAKSNFLTANNVKDLGTFIC